MSRRRGARVFLLEVAVFLLAWLALPACARAAAVDVIDVDLTPLIDDSASYPSRFAVDVPHAVALSTQGQWLESGSLASWTYSARIRTAVSMSFHATQASLPPSATLTVTGTSGSVTYRARDVNRGGLWARPVRGDTISLTLSVATAERAAVHLDIASFQAGYRGLGGGVSDNAHYHELMAAGVTTSGCTENYLCDATTANQGPARATVALVVGNVVQCTGTLLNDTSADTTPYVLTARHCENGQLGGGNPQAAALVTVYWDAVTPCSTTLSSIYDAAALTQSGATTLVEQQDAWLLQLDAAPVASDAYAAGWDATGGTFSGGYTVHHALGFDKQYVGWYGQPLVQVIPGSTLKIGYSSSYLGVVNQLGNLGAGASGSALFDPLNHAVGSASEAQLVQGANSAGVCPASPLVAPRSSSVTGQFTALAAVWNSTADTTSTTGTTTLQSVLDPAGTGKLVIDGVGIVPITLTSNAAGFARAGTGDPLTLTWNAPGMSSCTASGGTHGDGWTGTLPPGGSLQLTEQSAGQVRYALNCIGNGKIGAAAVSVTWEFVAAYVIIENPTYQALAGSTFPLQWFSNTQPCTASGGTPGDGWAGSKASSGSQTLTASTSGSVTYTLTCGSGGRTATAQEVLAVTSPVITPVLADGTQLRVGQPVSLSWAGGGRCTAGGGAAGDAWAGSVFTSVNGGPLSSTQMVTEATAGIYTYTVTCAGGGQSVNASVNVTFVDAPPTVAVTANSQAEVYTDTGSSGLDTLNWMSNVRPCAITYTGPGTIAGQVSNLTGSYPSGTALDSEAVAGVYRYTLTCGTGANQSQATAPIHWFTNQPGVTLNVNTPMPQGYATPLSWSSNVYPCTGTGGATGDGWAGAKAGAAGRQMLTESTLGNIAFGITCGSGAQIVQAQASTSVVTPTVSISASSNNLSINSSLVIQWTANIEPCSSTVSPGTAGWGTVLPKTGAFQTGALTPGTYTYTISCAGAQASVQVVFTGPAPTPPATLSAASSSAAVNTPVALSWTSASGSSCTASGGVAGDGWSGALASSGTLAVTSPNAGAVSYSINCSNSAGATQAQAIVTYTAVTVTEPAPPTPTVTLATSTANTSVGNSVTLTWSSQNASQCAATGGRSGDGWSGNLASSGSQTVTESSAGSFSYDITCTGQPPAAQARAIVVFVAVNTPAAKSSGGGGGALELPFLVMLGWLVWRTRRMSSGSAVH